VRVVETGGTVRAVLTYKEPPADQESQSKPEHETMVASPAVIDVILSALGLRHLVAFDKYCLNFTFTARGRDMLATLVTVPEIDGTFIELETMADEPDLPSTLADLRAVLGEVGISEEHLTTEQYTDAVMRARA
jgi:adenylate cyclase class 2